MYLAVGWLKLQGSLYHTDSLLLHKVSSVRNCKQFFLLRIHKFKIMHVPCSKTSHLIQWVCYNELSYNERMLQRTVFINKIRMLQQTRTTIGRRSTRMTCRTFPFGLESQSSSLLSFVRFSYQFSSVVCLFASLVVKTFFSELFCYISLAMNRQNTVRKLDGNFALGCGPGMDYP